MLTDGGSKHPEVLVNFCDTALRNIPEDSTTRNFDVSTLGIWRVAAILQLFECGLQILYDIIL
jgi:hypothetical protein